VSKFNIKSIISDHSGVTLLELMVAVSLFSVTIIMATGIFQSVVSSQRIAVASEDLQENIRYDFEKMGKEIRGAQKDYTHACIPFGYIYWTNGSQLEFLNYHGQCVKYYLNGGQIYIAYPNSGDSVLKNGLPLTPSELTISNLAFRITDGAAKVQASVSMRMHLVINIKAVPAEQIDMETTLSSRNYQ